MNDTQAFMLALGGFIAVMCVAYTLLSSLLTRPQSGDEE